MGVLEEHQGGISLLCLLAAQLAAKGSPGTATAPVSSHPSRQSAPPRAESRCWAGVFPRQLPPAQRNALNKDPKSLFAVEGRVSHARAPHC